MQSYSISTHINIPILCTGRQNINEYVAILCVVCVAQVRVTKVDVCVGSAVWVSWEPIFRSETQVGCCSQQLRSLVGGQASWVLRKLVSLVSFEIWPSKFATAMDLSLSVLFCQESSRDSSSGHCATSLETTQGSNEQTCRTMSLSRWRKNLLRTRMLSLLVLPTTKQKLRLSQLHRKTKRQPCHMMQ